jgi:hypothetical protein
MRATSFTCGAVLSVILVACVGDAPGAAPVGDGGAGDGGSPDGAAPLSCSDPSAPKCAHGKCTENGGAPVTCGCDPGYSGALCAACAPGFQDNGVKGTCAPACAAMTCGAHSACSDSTGAATCACVTGYAMSGSACAWRGGPLDPGFQNTPAGAWAMTAGLDFQPTAAGSVEPGFVHFNNAMICTTKARVSQTVAMPLYSTAEPLALRVVNKVVCNDTGQDCSESGGSDVHGMGVSLNKGFVELSSTDAFSGQVLCLGERAFGGPVEFVFSAEGDSCGVGTVAYDAVLDHVDVEPTPTCPLPGQIPNATFATNDKWVVAAGGGVAEIINGAGAAGGRGAHVQGMKMGDVPSLSQNLSVPGDATIPNLALTLNFTGNQEGLQVSLNGQDIGELAGSGGPQVGKVCVPDWAKGMALTFKLGFDLTGDGFAGSNTFDYRDFTFDGLKWASDPTCPARATIVDPGFERTDPARAWVLHNALGYAAASAISEITADARAHTGSRSLHLAVAGYCRDGSALQYYTVPASTSTEGPALSFWYKAPGGAAALSVTGVVGALPASAMWTKRVICLDPKNSDRPAPLRFSFSASGPCATTFAPLDAYVDDVGVGTDASCPR